MIYLQFFHQEKELFPIFPILQAHLSEYLKGTCEYFKCRLGLCVFLWSAPSSEKAARKKDTLQWKKNPKIVGRQA